MEPPISSTLVIESSSLSIKENLNLNNETIVTTKNKLPEKLSLSELVMNEEISEEMSLNQLLNQKNKKRFDKKDFVIENEVKRYTTILNFFESKRYFDDKKFTTNVIFTCKICKIKLQANFPCFSNLSKHLRKHTEFNKWEKDFKLIKKIKEPILTDKNLDLIKFFISSNTSLLQLKNPYFHKLFEGMLPSYHTFKSVFLPRVFTLFKEAIEAKLKIAVSVSLIADIWTTKTMTDFIAVAASITFPSYKKEIIIIGMIRMPGKHSADTIGKAIETIVNEYHFDKAKISCK